MFVLPPVEGVLEAGCDCFGTPYRLRRSWSDAPRAGGRLGVEDRLFHGLLRHLQHVGRPEPIDNGLECASCFTVSIRAANAHDIARGAQFKDFGFPVARPL